MVWGLQIWPRIVDSSDLVCGDYPGIPLGYRLVLLQ